MYFKSLELFGFKSFADRTKLVFEPGVTAIVGPNGVGKSNISDSIKWVLGEQSAKELRGGKMEDVIFNGTDSVQPVNIAEVSLVLSNEDRYLPVDYDEVIVTRRVFRSGESEYLLNKTQVRLKDIQDILLGTGIGTSSYSIAEQGKMDRVLNARPEDRREIFEEASGITKYKTKKKEALRKLEHTENNLLRLADIINEVKRQINSIERQAKKAEKYKEEFERLKDMDVKLSLRQYLDINQQKNTKDKDFEQFKVQEASLAELLNAYTQELKSSRQKISQIDQELSDIRNRLVNAITTIDHNKSNISMNKERVGEIALNAASLTKEIEQIDLKTDSLKNQIASMQQSIGGLKSEKDSKEAIVLQLQDKLHTLSAGTKDCESVMSQCKLNVMDNAANQSKIKNEVAKISADLISLSHRHRRLSAEKEAQHTEISSCFDKSKNAELNLRQQQDKTLAQQTQLKDTQEKLKILNDKLAALNNITISCEKTLASLSSKLEILSSLQEKKEGLSEGVTAYLEMLKDSLQAKSEFVGVLVDIVKVKAGYERAVEVALGDELQSIVLKNDTEAVRAIDYLKSQSKGKASFLILGRCRQEKRLFNFAHAQADTDLMSFVDCEESCRELVSYLFDGIFFAENLQQALSMVKESKGRDMRVVTKDGSCVSYNRIIGGGIGTNEYTGIVGRKFKLEQISQEIEDLNAKIKEAAAQRVDLMSEIESTQRLLQEQDTAFRECEKSTASSHTQKQTLENELKKLQEEFSLVGLELEDILQQEQELKNRNASLKEKLESFESEHQSLQDVILERQKTVEFNISEREKILVSFTEAKTGLTLLADKYAAQENTLSMVQDSLDKEYLNLEKRKEQIREGAERIEFLNKETQRLQQENEILDQQKEQFNAKVTELEQQRYSHSVSQERAEEDVQEKQKEIDGLKNNISSLQVNTTELNYQASSIKDRILQVYKINLDEAATVTFDGSEDWQAISAQVAEFKERIEKMGPVNLVAIDEHKELQERYEFLTAQQQDLLDAKESLHKAINRINRTTRTLFTETFDKIKEYFKEYFKLLFGGGAADIYLIDQADILESGIEIIVRPPGKKLQNISLLSGGEKALTSIALLFALFKVRPSPFCVLDEMDAPLDEANVDRFGRILKEFIKTSQFILITHNKKTISIANVLYGITMEKSGISKIVSVKFAEQEIEKKENQSAEVEVKDKVEVKAEAENKLEDKAEDKLQDKDKDKEPTIV